MKYLKLLVFLVNFTKSHRSNDCKSMTDYFTGSLINCWFNSDLNLDVPQLISKQGYPFKEYKVTTIDGYVLTLFRIPRENCKGIVFLRNPALSSSVVYVDKGKTESLAFLLWDEGYDVWLSNSRGGHYSRKHTYLNESQADFWKFSLNEMGLIDLPAEIKFVVNVTKVRPGGISCIGISMGASVSLIYASFFPEEVKLWINTFILLGPPAYFKYSGPMWKSLSRGINLIAKRAKEVNLFELFPYNLGNRQIFSLCNSAPWIFLCKTLILATMGNLPFDQTKDMWSLLFSHNPDGISLNVLVHFAQLFNTGKFQLFNYGEEDNLKIYQNKIPPRIPIENISVPVYLIYGAEDNLVNFRDVEHLYSQLKDESKIYGKLIVRNASHISFIYGKDIVRKIYNPIIRLINEIRGNLK